MSEFFGCRAVAFFRLFRLRLGADLDTFAGGVRRCQRVPGVALSADASVVGLSVRGVALCLSVRLVSVSRKWAVIWAYLAFGVSVGCLYILFAFARFYRLFQGFFIGCRRLRLCRVWFVSVDGWRAV